MKTNPFLLFRFSLFSHTFKSHPNSQRRCSSHVVNLPVSLSSFPHSRPSSQNHDGPFVVHFFILIPLLLWTASTLLFYDWRWRHGGDTAAERRPGGRSSSPTLTGARCGFFLLAVVRNAASPSPPCSTYPFSFHQRRRQLCSLPSPSPSSTAMCSTSLLFVASGVVCCRGKNYKGTKKGTLKWMEFLVCVLLLLVLVLLLCCGLFMCFLSFDMFCCFIFRPWYREFFMALSFYGFVSGFMHSVHRSSNFVMWVFFWYNSVMWVCD